MSLAPRRTGRRRTTASDTPDKVNPLNTCLLVYAFGTELHQPIQAVRHTSSAGAEYHLIVRAQIVGRTIGRFYQARYVEDATSPLHAVEESLGKSTLNTDKEDKLARTRFVHVVH